MKEPSKRIEEYLEAIYILQTNKGYVRVKDLSNYLNIKPSSVVDYLNRLSKENYIEYEKYSFIKLTDKGMKIAKNLYERHNALKEFLTMILDIDDEIAEKDACYIEHGIHEETLERIRLFIEFVKKSPKGVPEWIKHLKYYYKNRMYPEECEEKR